MMGGAEMAIKEITDRLSSSAKAMEDGQDFEFDLICARIDRALPKIERLGHITIYRVGIGSKLDKLFLPITGFMQASFLNISRRYDLIWAIMASQGGLTALFFKFFNPKTPFLLTLQEGDSLEYIKKKMKPFFIFKKIFQKADYIQAISNYLANWARDMGARSRIEVVPNGANARIKNQESRIKNEEKDLKSELNIKEDEKVIITVSRLVTKNGIKDLIEAMRYLDISSKLIIIGDGPLKKDLKLQVTSYKLQDNILFLGAIENDKIFKYLVLADVFIRPSLSEGLGNSFLEAMAMGVPIIGTSVGGIPDFLKNEETGLFCKVQNPKSIAEKINLILSDDDLRDRLINNAQKLVEEKYDWDKIADRMRNIFIALIHNS